MRELNDITDYRKYIPMKRLTENQNISAIISSFIDCNCFHMRQVFIFKII